MQTDASTATEFTADIRGLANQVRRQIQLAGVDARERWDGLQPRLRAYEHRMEVATDEAAAEVHRISMEIDQDLESDLRKLRQLIRG